MPNYQGLTKRNRCVFRASPIAIAVAAGCQCALATTYYVSPTGSDSNSGTSTSSPWQSVTQVDNSTFQPGDQILFQTGGNWYGSLNASSSGTTANPIVYGSYGTGPNPTFWGSNIVSSSSFQPVAGAADTYTYSTPTQVNSFFTNDQFSVSAALASGQTTDAGNISYVKSTPNTWYYDATTQQLYTNTGSAISAKNTYSVAVRQNAVNCYNESNVTFNNLTTNETAMYGGGYGINILSCNNITVNNCQAFNGGKNNVWVIDSNATINRVLASGVMPDQGPGGATAFVSYSDYNFTGTSTVYNNCVVTNYPGEPALFDHEDDAASISNITVNNFTTYGASVALGLGSGDHVQVNGGVALNTEVGIQGYATLNGMKLLGPNSYLSMSGPNNITENAVLSGVSPTNPYLAAVLDNGQNDVLRDSTVLIAPNASIYSNAISLANAGSNFSAYGNILTSPDNVFQTYYQVNASPQFSAPNDFSLADNVYSSPKSAPFSLITGNTPLTLAQVQAMGYDTGSIDGTPAFYDPSTQQWELISGSAGTNLVPLNSTTEGNLTDYTGAPRPQSGYDNAGAYGPNSVGVNTASINSTWEGLNVGTWAGSFNWSNGTPASAGNTANFDALEYGATAVTMDGTWTVGTMNFNNAQGYTISAGISGTLTLNNNSSAAQINVISGSHTISAPVSLVSNVTIAVGQIGGTMTISGNITGSGGVVVGPTSTASNVGTVVLSGVNSYSGGTRVTSGTLVAVGSGALPDGPVTLSGGVLQLAAGSGLSHISLLAISGTGTLDLTNNALIISYTGTSPISTIAKEIAEGYAGGAWTGSGITSSVLLNGANPKYGIGYADAADAGNPAGLASGQIEVMYTLLGDANLDGKVNGIDFAILAANFNKAVGGWDQGDFNYDGAANGSDFALLAENFNQGSNGAGVSAANMAALDTFAAANGFLADVPEPGSCALVLAGVAGVTLRRRRSVS